MSTKLTKFTGSINYSRDSKEKIESTLKSLQEYLNQYDEDEASKIIETMMKSQTTVKKSHRDQYNETQAIKLYSERTRTLEKIQITLKQISDDLIDEQDTSIKKTPGLFSKIGTKLSNGAKAVTSQIKKATGGLFSKLKNFIAPLFSALGWIGKLLFSPVQLVLGVLGLLGSLAFSVFSFGFRTVGGFVLRILGWVLKLGGKLLWHVGKLGIKVAFWLGKKLWNCLGWLGKKLWSAAKSVASWLGSSAKRISKGLKSASVKVKNWWKTSVSPTLKKLSGKIAAGAKKVGSWLGSAWDGTKKVASSAATKIGSAASKGWEWAKSAGTWVIDKVKALIPRKILNAGKILTRVGGKLIPGAGWALLAADVYAAANANNGHSFVANFLSNVIGGLVDTETIDDYINPVLSVVKSWKIGENTVSDIIDYVGQLNPFGTDGNGKTTSKGAITAGLDAMFSFASPIVKAGKFAYNMMKDPTGTWENFKRSILDSEIVKAFSADPTFQYYKNLAETGVMNAKDAFDTYMEASKIQGATIEQRKGASIKMYETTPNIRDEIQTAVAVEAASVVAGNIAVKGVETSLKLANAVTKMGVSTSVQIQQNSVANQNIVLEQQYQY